jgi:hypothetical protein
VRQVTASLVPALPQLDDGYSFYLERVT